MLTQIAALFNKAWFTESLHMTIAAFVGTSFAVAGIHAWLYLKGKNQLLHGKAIKIAMIFGAVAALLQPISGDLSAQDVGQRQPAKLAAMEAHFETGPRAPLTIGGIVDEENKEVSMAIKIPGLLSLMTHHDVDAVVTGLDQIPEDEQPPVAIVHYAFQIMVGLGMFLMTIGLAWLFFSRRKKGSGLGAKVVAEIDRIGYTNGIHRDRGWMDCDRGWASALDHPWLYENKRSRDPYARYSVHILFLYCSLSLPIISGNLVDDPTDQSFEPARDLSQGSATWSGKKREKRIRQ